MCARVCTCVRAARSRGGGRSRWGERSRGRFGKPVRLAKPMWPAKPRCVDTRADARVRRTMRPDAAARLDARPSTSSSPRCRAIRGRRRASCSPIDEPADARAGPAAGAGPAARSFECRAARSSRRRGVRRACACACTCRCECTCVARLSPRIAMKCDARRRARAARRVRPRAACGLLPLAPAPRHGSTSIGSRWECTPKPRTRRRSQARARCAVPMKAVPFGLMIALSLG